VKNSLKGKARHARALLSSTSRASTFGFCGTCLNFQILWHVISANFAKSFGHMIKVLLYYLPFTSIYILEKFYFPASSMASWINEERKAILEQNRLSYKGISGAEQKKLVRSIVRQLRNINGDALPSRERKVKYNHDLSQHWPWLTYY
jgi:hypothetical protein